MHDRLRETGHERARDLVRGGGGRREGLSTNVEHSPRSGDRRTSAANLHACGKTRSRRHTAIARAPRDGCAPAAHERDRRRHTRIQFGQARRHGRTRPRRAGQGPARQAGQAPPQAPPPPSPQARRRSAGRRRGRDARGAEPGGAAGRRRAAADSREPARPLEPPPPAVGAPITLAQATRLLWRAGFGPTPGQAEALAGQPVEAVVQSLTRPSGAAVLHGPAPTDDEGNALAPADAWGQDHCWWLDRMVRSDQQLVERMTFIWHDWFANSNEKVNSQQRMLDQNELFRATRARQLPRPVPGRHDRPGDAGVPRRHLQRQVGTERELRARDDGAVLARRRPRRLQRGRRARNGARADRLDGGMDAEQRPAELPLRSPRATTTPTRRCSARPANGAGKTRSRLCVAHPLHASFFVSKLWSYFVPTPPAEATLASLQGIYVGSGYEIRPVVEAILAAPRLPRRPGAGDAAGRLQRGPAARDRPADRHDRVGVAVRGRGPAAVLPAERVRLGLHALAGHLDRQGALGNRQLRDREDLPQPVARRRAKPKYSETEEPAAALAAALAYWGNPPLSGESQRVHRRLRAVVPARAWSTAKWQQSPYRAMRQNALRMLIATVAGHAGELSMAASCSCNDFTRAQLLRARRRAGRTRAAVDRAGPAAAGGQRHGPALVPAALGRRAAVGVRRLGAVAAASRGGHRRSRRGRAAQPAGARVDLHGRRLGRAVGARAGARSQVPRTAPDARARTKAKAWVQPRTKS